MSAADAASPTVILVDDDPAVLSALTFAFELDGFTVEAFASAEAVLRARELPSRGCLVVDFRLPGADGLELLTTLRKRDVRLPALMITTQPSAALRRRAEEAGVPIVEKPLLNDALASQVRSAIAAA